jgi:Xaa-Pro aminopeptidase
MQDTLQDDFLVAQGHGLGLSIREWPIIGPPTDAILTDSAGSFPVDAPLTPGMVVNLEVGGHHPDGTSVQVEQTFVISPAGTAELLSDQPRETPLVLGAAVPVHNSPVR